MDTSISTSPLLPSSGLSFQLLVTCQLEQPFISYDPYNYSGRDKCLNNHGMLPLDFRTRQLKQIKNKPIIVPVSAAIPAPSNRISKSAIMKARAIIARTAKEENRQAELSKRMAAKKAKHDARVAKEAAAKAEKELRKRTIAAKLYTKLTELEQWQLAKETAKIEKQEKKEALAKEKREAKEAKKLAREKLAAEKKAARHSKSKEQRRLYQIEYRKRTKKTDRVNGDYSRYPATYAGYKKLQKVLQQANYVNGNVELRLKMIERMEEIKLTATDIKVVHDKVYPKNYLETRGAKRRDRSFSPSFSTGNVP